jgi:peptidyl-prolyl cis-trans isomerase B (cyclophilin B)
MHWDTRTLIILGLVILFGWFFFQNRNKILPTGKLEESKPVNVSNLDTTTATEPLTGKPLVEIVTSKGKFIVELRPDVAQKTVINFLNKFSSGYCAGKTFHRVEDWVVQGCDPTGTGTGGQDNLPTETSTENFAAGSLGVARKTYPKDISNDSQFFITKKDSSFLNGEYTYFGKVTSGMDVINSLAVGDTILSTTILTK